MKPTVHYHELTQMKPQEGKIAFVVPVDHPSSRVSNKGMVATSLVVEVTDDGFETLNTVYVRIPEK